MRQYANDHALGVFYQGLEIGKRHRHAHAEHHDAEQNRDLGRRPVERPGLVERDGRDEEYVVCALLHDIGDTLGSFNHPDIAAAIVQPFVSEANHWMVKHHGIFQGHYFFHHIGLDRDMREQFREHPHYQRTAEFCELYDNPAFDPRAETLPLSEFEPMVRRLMARPKQSIYKQAMAR